MKKKLKLLEKIGDDNNPCAWALYFKQFNQWNIFFWQQTASQDKHAFIFKLKKSVLPE